MKTFASVALICAASLAVPAFADTAVGMWRTQSDGKGQRALVRSAPCGAAALCGTITAVEDTAGQHIKHPNIGVRLFWDMVPDSEGRYVGMAFVPAMKAKTKATMQVIGNKMIVKGCIGPVCKSQTWTRIK